MSTLGIDLDTKRITLAYIPAIAATRHWRVVMVPAKDRDALDQAMRDAYTDGVREAYIEAPAVRRGWKTHEDLYRIYGRIEAACEGAGINHQGVNVKTWQTAMLDIGVQAKRAELKRASMLRAAGELGREPKNDHEADAVCIAAWGMVQRRMAG